jgi:hypothetical protein
MHDTLHQVGVSQCPNCRAGVTGNYCQQCGQETVLHPPSAREFLHEFVGHYVALEGKLWGSLLLLLCRPGRLTREYIEGRRVRYVQPLRLYLTFSIIFFALFKFGDVTVGRDDSVRTATRPAVAQQGARASEEAAEAAGEPDLEPGQGAQRDVSLTDKSEFRAWIDGRSPALDAKVGKFVGLPKEEMRQQMKKGFYGYTPYALFLLMPVFAFWLKLLYLGSGRRFGEHLLFALHSNGFAFAALSLVLLTPAGLWPIQAAIGVWLLAYLPMAMRRVYGGSRTATLARWIALLLLHLVGFLLAIAAAALLTILTG